MEQSLLVVRKQFVTYAWEDATKLLHDFYDLQKNPTAPVPFSVFPPSSAASAQLVKLQTDMASQVTTANQQPVMHRMLSAFVSGELSRPAARAPSPAPSLSQRGRAPSRDGDRLSRSRSPSAGRSRYSFTDRVAHSQDNSSFWYKKPDTGERASCVYDYATLERIAGKSRTELDFPFLLSTRRSVSRLDVCCDPQAHTGGLDDPAHQLPFADFVEKVNAHFGQPDFGRPATKRAASPAATSPNPAKGKSRL